MPTIALCFPGRRYHATPWGHHVNEGLVEWPPSPWRLLRALLATGHTKLQWREVPPLGVSLLEKLAGVLPRFSLPPASTAHSRHFMPAPVKTTLVFDTWAQIEEGELRVDWQVELTPDERDLFATLVAGLSYLGRSESWVDARWVPDPVTTPSSYPCEGTANPGLGWEQVSLLATEAAPTYVRWRASQVERRVAELAPPKATTRRPTAKALAKAEEERAKLEAPFPKDLIGCLGVDTSWLQKHGWSQPPGSCRVLYWRRSDALEVGSPIRQASPRTLDTVECVLFAIATASRSTGALPPVVRAFPQALLLHRAFADRAKGPLSETSRLTLLGRTADGNAAATNHGHSHVLPLDLDQDHKLDHILIWAPLGLDSEAREVVRSLRRTFAKRVKEGLQLTVIAEGSLAEVGRVGDPLRQGLSRVLGGKGARTWVSATPYFPPRFLKTRGRNSLEGQIRTELETRGLRACRSVEVLPKDVLVNAKFLHYVRRDARHQPKVDRPLALRLTFEDDVLQPICLGYGSHYGLGRFEVVR